jgi:hypothetical protein
MLERQADRRFVVAEMERRTEIEAHGAVAAHE